jgi:hypothetical protein
MIMPAAGETACVSRCRFWPRKKPNGQLFSARGAPQDPAGCPAAGANGAQSPYAERQAGCRERTRRGIGRNRALTANDDRRARRRRNRDGASASGVVRKNSSARTRWWSCRGSCRPRPQLTICRSRAHSRRCDHLPRRAVSRLRGLPDRTRLVAQPEASSRRIAANSCGCPCGDGGIAGGGCDLAKWKEIDRSSVRALPYP